MDRQAAGRRIRLIWDHVYIGDRPEVYCYLRICDTVRRALERRQVQTLNKPCQGLANWVGCARSGVYLATFITRFYFNDCQKDNLLLIYNYYDTCGLKRPRLSRPRANTEPG